MSALSLALQNLDNADIAFQNLEKKQVDDNYVAYRECKQCGKRFTPTNNRQKFCCQPCRRKWHKSHPTAIQLATSGKVLRRFTCRHCGKEIAVYDRKDKRTDFCSEACRGKGLQEK